MMEGINNKVALSEKLTDQGLLKQNSDGSTTLQKANGEILIANQDGLQLC